MSARASTAWPRACSGPCTRPSRERRREPSSPGSPTRLRLLRRPGRASPRQSEIEDLRPPGGRHLNIAGLSRRDDNTAHMLRRQARRNLSAELDRLCHTHRLLWSNREAIARRGVPRRNRRCRQHRHRKSSEYSDGSARRSPRASLRSARPRRIACGFAREQFSAPRRVQPLIARPVHLPHAPSPIRLAPDRPHCRSTRIGALTVRIVATADRSAARLVVLPSRPSGDPGGAPPGPCVWCSVAPTLTSAPAGAC